MPSYSQDGDSIAHYATFTRLVAPILANEIKPSVIYSNIVIVRHRQPRWKLGLHNRMYGKPNDNKILIWGEVEVTRLVEIGLSSKYLTPHPVEFGSSP